jgi:hypothetical protein
MSEKSAAFRLNQNNYFCVKVKLNVKKMIPICEAGGLSK